MQSALATFRRRASGVRRSWTQHREQWVVGGGLAAGATAALLPRQVRARIGALLLGAAALVLRSPISGVLLGSMLRTRGENSSTGTEEEQ